jgi:hypothetical protein
MALIWLSNEDQENEEVLHKIKEVEKEFNNNVGIFCSGKGKSLESNIKRLILQNI